MSTSLAEQLQRLAVPQTTLLSRDKKRASLLFNPKEAANLNRETVYQIGLDGFEELKYKNPAFIQFENTLFHITSKSFERAVVSAEGNEQLNKTIKKFLLLVSPYFLLNSSHKALEWLINRYEIHEYNKEDILMLILPYHETNIFVRALQLMQFKDANNKWYWLSPLQKPGVHLPKQTLFNHAASDVYFLKFVSKYVFSMIKIHERPASLTVVFNFYCTTFTGALEYSPKINEAQVTQMLPPILKGLNSDIPDFVAASYVITAKLLSKSQLSDKILEQFVNKISESSVKNLQTEAVLMLIVLYQFQKQFSHITARAIGHLVERKWVPKVLQELSNGGSHIYPLLEPLLISCVKLALLSPDNLDNLEFVDNLLTNLKIKESFVSRLICFVLDQYNPKRNYSEAAQTWLKSLLNKIETQYPIFYDNTVKQILKPSEKSNAKRQKKLRKIIKTTIVTHGSLETLYHPTPETRIQGIHFLAKRVNTLSQHQQSEAGVALLDRLRDENADVVAATLNDFRYRLKHIIDEDNLKKELIELLAKCQRNKEVWWRIAHVTSDVLCTVFTKFDLHIFLALLKFLFPTSNDELRVAKFIMNTKFFKCDILQPLRECLKLCTTSDEFSTAVYNGLSLLANHCDVTALLEMLGVDNDKGKALDAYLAMLFLSSLLEDNCTPTVSCKVLEVFVRYVNHVNMRNVRDDANAQNLFLLARRNKIPLQGFTHCLENLILKVQLPTEQLGRVDFCDENDSNKFILLFLKFVLKGCFSRKAYVSVAYAGIFKAFSYQFCNNFALIIELLLNVAVTKSTGVDSVLQLRCLRTASSLLAANCSTDFISHESVIVPYVLVALSSEFAEVRIVAVEIIETLLTVLSDDLETSYETFLCSIANCKDEILMDHEQIPLIFYNLLSGGHINENTHNALVNVASANNYPACLVSGVLCTLAHINNIVIFSKTLGLPLEFFKTVVGDSHKLNSAQLDVVYRNILRFDISIAGNIELSSSAWKFVESCFKNDSLSLNCGKTKTTCPAVLILNQIDRDVFAKLNPAVQAHVLEVIIELTSVTQNPEVLRSAGRVFKRIDLDAALVLPHLNKIRDAKSPKQVDLTKRRKRVAVLPTIDILDTTDWKKGVTVLEFMQDKKKIRNMSLLLPVLFEILKKCLDFDEQSSVEYPKQLILSSILHFCVKIADEKLPESAFNMESVVQCIRASQNPQTHHHALLVLAHTAKLIPKQVLHHIIAVFTFVGSSVLRHDDAYSFQIITKIIETVIPILVEDGSIESITCVLRVFVDALLDIPEHRRMPLFKHLLTRLDPSANLYYFLLLVFESHVLSSPLGAPKRDRTRALYNIEETSKRLDIASNLCREFPPDVVIATCIKLMGHLRKLPEEKEDLHGIVECGTFDIVRHTAKQFRHYKYTIVTFTASLLSSKEFVEQIANDDGSSLEQLFKDMIINVLTYIQTTSKITEQKSNTAQAQYWKVMLHHSYDILDSLNALLTSQMFLLVVRGLMTHSLFTVRRRAIELLNSKLQYNASFFLDTDEVELFALVPATIKIIKTIENDSLQTEEEHIIQTALFSLKLLIRVLAPKYPEKFVQLLDFVTEVIKSGKAQDNVLASVILCLAELCSNLRAYAISSLNRFMPVLIKVLKVQKRQASPSLLLVSILTAIQKILDSLPLFLSPYLEKILFELSLLSCEWESDTDNAKLAPFITKLGNIQQTIGTIIPPRVLIPAIENSYDSLIKKKCYTAIGALMQVLSYNVNNLKGPEIQGNLPELTTFFLSALQLREISDSSENANEVEGYIVKTLSTLVLKLSESTFRPLYYKLFDWAVRTDVKTQRVITFYNLSSTIANALKGLFVLFAAHFLNNAATLLDACNKIKNDELYFEDETQNVLLIEYILKTLYAVFLYDSQKFVDKERFEVLMQVIVDQLENTIGDLEHRAKTLLTPCIVHFAVATADDSLWKQMNYQILLKTRNGSSTIRLIALECLSETARKLGEDFLPLLPETIPFLAELLEDEDENVEKACQKAVQELEKVLGEPLQKYF